MWFSIWMLICVLFLPITWTWGFERLILRPSCELDLNTSETKVCRSSSDSASSAISSANLRLLITLPFIMFMQAPMLESWSAWSMATSSKILKSCRDVMQPCLTPTLVENQSVREPFTLTALRDWMYKAWCICLGSQRWTCSAISRFATLGQMPFQSQYSKYAVPSLFRCSFQWFDEGWTAGQLCLFQGWSLLVLRG